MSHSDLRWRIVSFDIRDAKRYRRAAKILKGAAVRLQYSVFRARLDDRGIERLRWELARELADEDALLVIDLCPHCASRVVAKNQVDDWSVDPPTVIFPGATPRSRTGG